MSTCRPTYPAPASSVEDARKTLREVMQKYVACIDSYQAASADYRRRLKHSSKPKQLATTQ